MDLERKMRQNLHELKTSYSNSGFLTTPYEHLFKNEDKVEFEEREHNMDSTNKSQVNVEGYKVRAAISGNFESDIDPDFDGLIRMRDNQKATYDVKLDSLKSKIMKNNRHIAELKAHIAHYKSKQQ